MITDATGIPYVQSSASLQVPPPYHFPGVTVNAFVWEASMARVQAYCDTFFNLGSAEERGFTYRAVPQWPYATLLFLDYPVMVSSNPHQDTGDTPYCDRGIISQTEVFVALPVMRVGAGPAKLVTHSELEWALPFIAVGNPMSAVCGREMLGLGKLLAEITTGEGKFPYGFQGIVKLPGWSEQRTGVRQQVLPLLTVQTGPLLPTFRGSDPIESIATLLQSREAGWAMSNMASVANLVDTASIGLLPTSLRTVGLKQYRDALDPERAVYQALVTCRSHYSNVREFCLYDEDDVDIEFNDVGSFHDILSVFLEIGETPTGAMITAKPVGGYRFMADIDYDLMRVIHQFAIDGPDGQLAIPARSDLVARWFRPWHGFFKREPGP